MTLANWTIRAGSFQTFKEETAFVAGTITGLSAEAKIIDTTPSTLLLSDASSFPNESRFIRINNTDCLYSGKSINTLNNVRTQSGSVSVVVGTSIRIQNGALKAVSDGSIMTHNATLPTDTNIEVELEMASAKTTSAPGSQNGQAVQSTVGAVLRYTLPTPTASIGNFYLCSVANGISDVNTVTHALRFYRIFRHDDNGNIWTLLAQGFRPFFGRYTDQEVNVPRKITARAIGSSISIMLDDVVMASAVDATYAQGQSGIGRRHEGSTLLDNEISINRVVISSIS